MAGSTAVDGLISGMSTSQVISQLMQVESASQTKLKNRVTTQQNAISAFQSINAKASALKTATAALMDATAWKAVTATSTSSSVTATASNGAASGQLTFDVNRLATANVRTAVVADPTASLQSDPASGFSITIGTTTTPITVDPTKDTAQGAVDAINKANIGVRAALVDTQQGKILQLTATRTGAANAFTVTGLNVGLTQVTAGTDAQLTVGTVGAGGYTMTSADNTFTNVLPGVNVKANQPATGVTVTVAADVGGIADKVQAMVDATNGLLTDAGARTIQPKTIGTTKTSTGAIAGNFMVQTMMQDVLSSVSQGQPGYGSFKQLGIELTRDGQLKFDRSAFTAAYQADPTKVQTAVSSGLATTFNKLATTADTNLTAAIQSGTKMVGVLNDQIDSWDRRLAMRKEALEKQYANLEVALGKLRDQSNWLAGQLNSLPSNRA